MAPPPLLPIEESTGKKKSILRIFSTTVVINCICSAQTIQQTNKNAAGRGKWARVQKKILGLPGDDDTEMFLRFYSRAGVAAATPGAAFACSVIAGRHGD